ncbi:hypothetical protein HPP92_028197 [Vanilla planifolia]|uniref:Uncharacterized protein n=1 Tax=Vanilla planifolia TaxID=51239 RepID=A0A835P8U6_VANPL|nr:hypothetical protein HPP92_028197 [Vanilla planifolia]
MCPMLLGLEHKRIILQLLDSRHLGEETEIHPSDEEMLEVGVGGAVGYNVAKRMIVDFVILLLLLRDSSNCKIRMHAAVALAVPSSRLDYGNSFCDVVQELEHLLETIGSHQSVTPSSFKYKDNLEKQLILTTIHVLGFVTLKDGLALNDFFLKKAQFLEEWFKALCSSLMETPDQPSACMATSTGNRADLMATNVPKNWCKKALKSLYDVYESSNHRSVAERFEKLIRSFS